MISATQKNKICERALFVFLGAVLFQGCISIGTHERRVREAYLQGVGDARNIAWKLGCNEAVSLIDGKADAH